MLDSHFTRLAMGGAADANLVGCLKALKKSVGGEAECCELLCQVKNHIHCTVLFLAEAGARGGGGGAYGG